MSSRVRWWKTRLGDEEAEAARKAIAAGKISQGANTAELEERLAKQLEVPYVTMTTSGSVALLMALIACGVRPGDEVIIANRTFIAAAHAVQLLGARVRLVDTLPRSPTIDPEGVRAAITRKTKALIPVHLNGRSCNISLLQEIADHHGIFLIEDAAQAMFSINRDGFLGTLGHFGCYSLGVTKLITSGQGGFVVTRDKTFHDLLRLIRTHGVDSPLCEHFDRFGFNFRYTDIQAAIALKQLEQVADKIKAHLHLYKLYYDHIEKLRSIHMLEVDTDNGEIPLWIEVLCEERDRLREYLAQKGIEARRATPNLNASLHLRDTRDFPNSDYFEQHLLTLPSGPDQDPADIKQTLDVITKFEEQHKSMV